MAQSTQDTITFDALSLADTNQHFATNLPVGNYSFVDSINSNRVEFFGRKESWGGFAGATYSNITDTNNVTYTNDIAAYNGVGASGSTQYVTAYGLEFGMKITPNSQQTLSGVYVNNTRYTATSMENGDMFAKKFGGLTGDDEDYYKVIFYGYQQGVKIADSVEFYLADYRFSDNTQDYIIKDWTFVDLSLLASADSISFDYVSTDVGDYGYNTPTYFCMDNMVFKPKTSSVKNVAFQLAKFYPNPATEMLNIQTKLEQYNVRVFNALGAIIVAGENMKSIDVHNLNAGNYFVEIVDIKNGQRHIQQIVKY